MAVVLLCILCRIKLLGDICYAPLERYLALRGVFSDYIGLRSYNVQDYVITEVCLEFLQPSSHLFEGLWVGDVIA